MTAPKQDPYFRPIGEQVNAANGGDDEPLQAVQEIESLCMECGKQGVTRLLPIYIPYFREVIVVSFSCPYCGCRNSEVQSAGMIQEKGCVYTVHCTQQRDLDRQMVKSEYATISVPDLQLQIPAKRGQITTIEGVLSDTLRDLEVDQPVRKHMQPDVYAKIEQVCDRLRDYLGERKVDEGEQEGAAAAAASSASGAHAIGPVGGRTEDAKAPGRTFPPFKLQLDDPSGNSFIEFTGDIEQLGAGDNKWTKRDYPRTKEQNEMLGLMGTAAPGDAVEKADPSENVPIDNEEIFHFDGSCSSCNAPCRTMAKRVNIPYFKDILILSTNCDNCGYRDNEVKSGSAISEKGRKLTLRVQDAEDLSRDILKSESAGLAIPEIDLNLAPGTLGGRFTTLEGLLQNVYDELYEKVLMRGDSARLENVQAFEGFLGRLKAAISAEACPYTVILDDPLANSYIQNPYAPDPDEQITSEWYERTYEQNEDFGLNDILVENYNPDGTPAGGADKRTAAAPQDADAKKPRTDDGTTGAAPQ